jgi:hypothetical protein
MYATMCAAKPVPTCITLRIGRRARMHAMICTVIHTEMRIAACVILRCVLHCDGLYRVHSDAW